MDPTECFESELQSWCLQDEEVLSLDKNYILKVAGRKNSNKVCLLTSEYACHIYLYNSSKLKGLQKYDSEIKFSDAKLSPSNDSLLYTSALDGSISLWDERAGATCQCVFQENSETKEFTKPLLSLDVSCNDRVLCGGTELCGGDAFLLFWDVRKPNLLGAYWNSHTDDIVQVCFGQTKSDELMTAGSDGLINLFNITELTEDDALQYSLNAECPVDRICTYRENNTIACITDNVDVQLWDVETADQVATFPRESVSAAMKLGAVEDCYIVDVCGSRSGAPCIFGGSYADHGKHLRSVEISSGMNLKPSAKYDGNKQIVRSGFYDDENDLLLTGGEAGILSLWKNESCFKMSGPANRSERTSDKWKKHKQKPY